MCLVLLALKVHPEYDLILLSNRDEYYDRPTAPACFWEEYPDILAGQDLRAGGTWLGITGYGRIATITNYRDPSSLKDDGPSRGGLVTGFLQSSKSTGRYLDDLRGKADNYNGFSLLLGDREQIYSYSNRTEVFRSLSPGIYGLSNHLLDTPWPKVILGKKLLGNLLSRGDEIIPGNIFSILSDHAVPADDSLPDTGVGLDLERILSPIFVSSPTYGTRSSTLITIDRGDRVRFIETTHGPGIKDSETVRYDFQIKEHR